jgi:hypothetical protein
MCPFKDNLETFSCINFIYEVLFNLPMFTRLVRPMHLRIVYIVCFFVRFASNMLFVTNIFVCVCVCVNGELHMDVISFKFQCFNVIVY